MRRDDDDPTRTAPQPGPEDLDAERLVLRVLTDGALFSHPLPREGRVVIGRGREADLRIDHVSLSRNHAALTLGPTPRLEDLGSANGTRVGDRVLGDGESIELGLDQPVHLGSALVLLQRGGPRGGPASRAADGGFLDRMRPVLERIAKGRIAVLLLGETGVGKEVMARETHRLSARAEQPFVTINCAALAENLLESELFGHERGAFTSAAASKPGLIESANGGTVFLDEIGELPLAPQVKLLRVLEDRAVQRIGALRPIVIDVRFVAATNRDLEADVAAGRFRSDLYFRLNGFALTVPPLRERRDEIRGLAAAFIAEIAALENHAPPAIAPAALALLLAYSWPGNIRELRNMIERAVLLARTGPITPEHLPVETLERQPGEPDPIAATRSEPRALRDDVRELERKRIIDVLARCAGNQSRAARELGISRPTLITRMEEYGLPRPRRS